MYLSRSVPEEVWLEIMSHLSDERDTLRAAINAGCAASFAATRIYWANITLEKGLLDELKGNNSRNEEFIGMVRRGQEAGQLLLQESQMSLTLAGANHSLATYHNKRPCMLALRTHSMIPI
jgi:hypothetical protein